MSIARITMDLKRKMSTSKSEHIIDKKKDRSECSRQGREIILRVKLEERLGLTLNVSACVPVSKERNYWHDCRHREQGRKGQVQKEILQLAARKKAHVYCICVHVSASASMNINKQGSMANPRLRRPFLLFYPYHQCVIQSTTTGGRFHRLGNHNVVCIKSCYI